MTPSALDQPASQASDAPILIVPAMHPNMWLNSATVQNVETLRSRGFSVLDPEVGRLSGKDFGVGRFPDSSKIVSQVLSLSKRELLLEGKRILVTAGGTREEIDPVRFIGNKSSGRQGLAIAYEALRSGAEVTVIAGHTDPFELEKTRRDNPKENPTTAMGGLGFLVINGF